VTLGFRLTMADPAAVPEDVVRAHIQLVRERRGDPDAAAAFIEGARSVLRLLRLGGPYRTALDRVRCPVLVVHGDRDRFVPPAFARAACRAHPEWALRMLGGIGHVPQLEAPDRWLAAVERWNDDRLPQVTAEAARPAAPPG
jgi:pimeloyl-ACP methyl ester carboxylesterase